MDFCDSCKQFNISLESFISDPGTDDNPRLQDPIYSLGALEEISRRSKTCDLCQLLSKAFRDGPLKNVPLLSDHRQISLRGTWINTLGPSREQRLKSSALSILVWPESPRIPQATYKLVIRAVSPLLPDQPHFGRLCPIDWNPLDFGLIRGWLKHCENTHTKCHSANTVAVEKPTTTYLVIDVKQYCIIPAPDQCRYIALSYVWGKTTQLTLNLDNLGTLLKKNSLRNFHLPRTISDAIKLVEKLGERYLWVDALCIIQDSEAVRRQCIEDMDRIYIQSLLTIVAGTAENSESPLLGVTKNREWLQWSTQISENLTLSLHFDFKDFLDCSTYNQRAWTMQEYQLANRLLIFTSNEQVYFSCKEAVYSEEVVPGNELEVDGAMKDGAELIKLHPDRELSWTTYRRGVEMLTSRKMTYEGDILNAFRGILRTISPGPSLEGFPVSLFDMALLWQPRERLNRRAGFSSWSWAGWAGKVTWFDDGSLDNSRGSSEADKLGTLLKEKCWIVWYSSFGKFLYSPAFHMDGPPWLRGYASSAADYERRFGFQPPGFTPTPDLLPRRLSKNGHQGKYLRYLQFWTVSAYFKIQPDVSGQLKVPGFDHKSTENGLRLFLLRDANDKTCGWVLLDVEWTKQIKEGSSSVQEFILVSEGHSSTTARLWDPAAGADGEEGVIGSQEFNAMMVTWAGGIAERAGLGRIVKAALWNCCKREMRWKEIILG